MAYNDENRGFFNGWGVGAGAAPTIYDNGGLPTPTDRIPVRVPQQAAPGSNYAGDGATDPDTNARNLSAPSRINVSSGASRMYAGALDRYDPFGTKPMRDASEAGRQQIQSLYPRGTYPDASFRDMANTLADESAKRMYGPTTNRSGAANPNSVYGQGSVRTSSGIGTFAEDGQTYNVGATSQDNIRRVTGGKLNSPLYTNIDPSQAVAGLRNQTIGQPADEERLGLERMQRANDIRGQMIANRDKDIPAGGYGPGILGDMGGGKTQIDLDNGEKTQRWAQDAMLQYAKNNPEMRGIVQQIIQSGSARDINANNVAGRMNELGLQGRNQLAGYGLQGQNQLANTLLGEELRGRNQQALEGSRFDRETTLQDRRFANEAPYREAQTQGALNQGRYYGAQADSLARQAEFDKTADASIQKWAKLYIDSGADPQTAIKEATRMYLGSKRQAEAKYADGGAVDPKVAASQKLLLEMQQKYGGAPATPQQQAPAPVQQPAPQQPRQETWAEKARRIGTGGLDRRMEGYAGGGAVDVGGRQVLGEGTGKSDSLPAIIDGQHPAALSTEEFVFPVETVRHFGLAKLNKMVEQSRKGLATGREAA